MMEYDISKLEDKCREFKFKPHETEGVKFSYYWFASYTGMKTAKPRSSTNPLEFMQYMEYKFREAYNFSLIRIQRTIDEWHEKEVQK